ncbi:MAG TPA: hypothetical protein VNA16_07705, partial [Abditibacteriaceae bacterium]|nr:hypothetical protein [Abditibacteriaceae bacterium]
AMTVTRSQITIPPEVLAPTERTPLTAIHQETRTKEMKDGFLIQGTNGYLYKTDRDGKLRFILKGTVQTYVTVEDSWFAYQESLDDWNSQYRLFDLTGRAIGTVVLPKGAYSAWSNGRHVHALKWIGMDGWTKQGPTIYEAKTARVLSQHQFQFGMGGYGILNDGSFLGVTYTSPHPGQLVKLSPNGKVAWLRPNVDRLLLTLPDGSFSIIKPHRSTPTTIKAQGQQNLQDGQGIPANRENLSQICVLERQGKVVFTSEPKEYADAWFLDNGKYLVFQHAVGRDMIRVRDFKRLWSSARADTRECVSPDGKKLFGLSARSKSPKIVTTPGNQQIINRATYHLTVRDMATGKEIAAQDMPFEVDESGLFFHSMKAESNQSIRCFFGSEIWVMRLKATPAKSERARSLTLH